MGDAYGSHGLSKVADSDYLRDAVKAVPNANVEAVEAALAGMAGEAELDRRAASGRYDGRPLADVLGASSLGEAAEALLGRVAAADYSGLRVGDYLEADCGQFGTRRFAVAAFDPYYKVGDTASKAHGRHICFVDSEPIEPVAGCRWNATCTNQGTSGERHPYLASELRGWEAEEVLPALPPELSGLMVERRELLEERYRAGEDLEASNRVSWASLGKLWSLSEAEVFGCAVWGTPGYSVGASRQLEYFRDARRLLNGRRVGWWLRTVSGAGTGEACAVSSQGYVYPEAADSTRGIRCAFLLG